MAFGQVKPMMPLSLRGLCFLLSVSNVEFRHLIVLFESKLHLHTS